MAAQQDHVRRHVNNQGQREDDKRVAHSRADASGGLDALQAAVGNQAVQRLIERMADTSMPINQATLMRSLAQRELIQATGGAAEMDAATGEAAPEQSAGETESATGSSEA
jgi:hypothetical protein